MRGDVEARPNSGRFDYGSVELAPLVDTDGAASSAAGVTGDEQAPVTWAVTLFAFGSVCCPTIADFVFSGQLNVWAARLEIDKSDRTRTSALAAAAGLVYLIRILGRLGHGLIFSWLQPRGRCMAGILLLLCGVGLLFGVYLSGQKPLSVDLVYFSLAAAIVGLGNGVLVANALSYLGSYKDSVKGVVGAAYAGGWGVPGVVVYAAQAMSSGEPNHNYGLMTGLLSAVVVGCAVTIVAIFNVEHHGDGVSHDVASFRADLKRWREWLPLIRGPWAAIFVSMFVASVAASTAQLYYGSGASVALLPGVAVDPKWLLCGIFAIEIVVGFASTLLYYDTPNHLRITLVGSLAMLVLTFTTVPVLGMVIATSASFALSAFELAAGSVAAERSVGRQFSLTAMSVWIIGYDIGAGTGTAAGGGVAALLQWWRPVS